MLGPVAFVVLEDGTRIEYGALPSSVFTYAQYLQEKPLLLEMLATYAKDGTRTE
jgi:hypothetical protein